MRISTFGPMLWTEDLKGSVDFYVDVLGFTCQTFREDWGWASLSQGDIWFMLSRPFKNSAYDKIGFTGSFYFTTDEVDQIWDELKDKVKVCYGIEDFHYGMREFGIYDNNGYLIQFGQPID
jgi:uncharacterized glyoxalase superfamily protein PhnB